MYKIKTTKKEMRENWRIIGIGYCNAEGLLHYENPVAYSAGAHGWACDYYEFDGVIISTGYSHLNNKNAQYSYETLRDYNDRANKIIFDYSSGESRDEKKSKVRELLREFVKYAITNKGDSPE